MKKFISFLLFYNAICAYSQIEVVTNGDFSQNNQGWDTDGDFYFGSTYSTCHSCPGYGYLSTTTGNKGNNLSGSLLQYINIPSNASSATLSIWFSCNSEEAPNDEFDKVDVIIENFNGQQIVLGTYYASGGQQPYVNFTYNIPTSFFGSSFLLTLFGATDISFPSVIRVDDVSIKYFTNNNNFPPVADFSANNTNITSDQTVQFYDQSSNAPYVWEWTFEGGNPAFSSDSDPSVVYSTPGTYDVTLRSKNDEGWSDYVTKSNYITVVNNQSYSINGTVFNVKINESAGIIENIGLQGASVSIYPAGSNSVLSTTATTSNGSFIFENLNTGQYDIRVSFNGFSSKKFSISPGSNIGFKLPITLVSQINTLIGFLESTNLELTTNGDDDFLHTTLLYDQSGAKSLINSYQSINNNYDNKIESLARLQLSQRALYDYLTQEIPINKLVTQGGTELLSTLFGLLVTYENLNKVIQQWSWVPNSWKQEVFELKFIIEFTYGAIISKILAKVSNVKYRAIFESSLESLTEFVIDKSSSFAVDQIGVEKIVARKISDANIQKFYTPETQESLDFAVSQSTLFSFSNNFSSAFFEVKNQTATSKSYSDNAQSFCQSQLLYSGIGENISDITGYAADIVAAGGLIQLGGILQLVSKVAEGSEIVFLSSSIGKGLHRTNAIGNELVNVINYAYSKHNFDSINLFNFEKQVPLNGNVTNAVIEYNTELNLIRDLINAGKISMAVPHFKILSQKNTGLNYAIDLAFNPISATLPYISDPVVFDSSYYSFVTNLYSKSPVHRVNVAFSFFSVLFDSLNISHVNNFNALADSAISSNNNLISELDNFIPLLIFGYSPAYIVAIDKDVPKYLPPNVNMPAKIKFQNFGNTEGHNIYAKIAFSDGYITSVDSIFIGSMQPGEVDSITFSVASLQSIGFTGDYSVLFYGEQTDCKGIGGFVVTDIINSVKNKSDKQQNISEISLSPNPVRDFLSLDLQNLTVDEDMRLRIISAAGYVMIDIPFTNIIDVQHLEQGAYFLEVGSTGLTKARGKFLKL
jgi:PKD repeat protein